MNNLYRICKKQNIKTPNELAESARTRHRYLKPSIVPEPKIELYSILSQLSELDAVLYLEILVKIDQKPWSADLGEKKLIELIELSEDILLKYRKHLHKFDALQKKSKNILIKWLKSEEALRQLIESLKENGLIQSRETDDIIQHFEVSGRETKQAQLAPINWIGTARLLVYLIEKMSEIRSNKIISVNDIWKDTIYSHFLINGDIPKKHMRQSANKYKSNKSGKPHNAEVIESILNALSDK